MVKTGFDLRTDDGSLWMLQASLISTSDYIELKIVFMLTKSVIFFLVIFLLSEGSSLAHVND